MTTKKGDKGGIEDIRTANFLTTRLFNNIFMFFMIALLLCLNSCVNNNESTIDYQNPDFADSEILVRQMVSGTSMEEQTRAMDAVEIIIKSEGGLENIVSLLQEDDAETRKDSAAVLGSAIRGGMIDYSEPILIDPLIDVLADSDSEVRWHACSTIGDIISVGFSSGNTNPLGDAKTKVLQGIMVQLDDEVPNVIVLACNTLSLFGSDAVEASESLRSLFNNDDPLVRIAAAAALAKIDPTNNDGVNILKDGVLSDYTFSEFRIIPNIDDVYPAHTNRTSALALGLIGPPAFEALPSLFELFDDPDTRIQEIAVQSGATICDSDEASIGLLIDLLTDENPNMRSNAARTLGKIGSPAIGALEELYSLLNDENDEVRVRASEAISRIETPGEYEVLVTGD